MASEAAASARQAAVTARDVIIERFKAANTMSIASAADRLAARGPPRLEAACKAANVPGTEAEGIGATSSDCRRGKIRCTRRCCGRRRCRISAPQRCRPRFWPPAPNAALRCGRIGGRWRRRAGGADAVYSSSSSRLVAGPQLPQASAVHPRRPSPPARPPSN